LIQIDFIIKSIKIFKNTSKMPVRNEEGGEGEEKEENALKSS